MTDIWIAGLGLQTVSHVTREVELAIRSSREVLYLDTGVATRSFLEPLCPRIASLYEESYSEEGPRILPIYRPFAAVLSATARGGGHLLLPPPNSTARHLSICP